MGLETYHQKRDFRRTPEPRGKISKANKHRFVCQEHHASKLHFDFRLEIAGVLKSWSLPKGPSMNSDVRRLAVPTEDHPVEYLKFQGRIPGGNYGAGEHMIWDSGTYKLLDGQNAEEQFEKGRLKFELDGGKLKGTFSLFRLGGRDQWLLVKGKDKYDEDDWKLELLMPGKDGNRFVGTRKSPPAMVAERTEPAKNSSMVSSKRRRDRKKAKSSQLPLPHSVPNTQKATSG